MQRILQALLSLALRQSSLRRAILAESAFLAATRCHWLTASLDITASSGPLRKIVRPSLWFTSVRHPDGSARLRWPQPSFFVKRDHCNSLKTRRIETAERTTVHPSVTQIISQQYGASCLCQSAKVTKARSCDNLPALSSSVYLTPSIPGGMDTK